MGLEIMEVRKFVRTVEFKEPSPDGKNNYRTHTFGVTFKIMDDDKQRELIERVKAAVENGDREEVLSMLDEIVVGYEGIKEKGEDVPFDVAHAYVKRYMDIATAVIEEYNLALKQSGNVRAKNLKR